MVSSNHFIFICLSCDNSKKMPRKSTSRRSPRKSGGKLRLVKIVKSPKKEKKYMAVYSDGKKVHFGARGMGDHIIYSRKSKSLGQSRKQAYIGRHKRRENWGKSGARSPGSLSRWILWNKPSLRASISDYKRKFNL